MNIAEITLKMIESAQGNQQDINHFLKVYAYAKTIGEAENLSEKEQDGLEVAALLHDIACPLCRIKYGNTSGNLQEIESPSLVRAFLKDMDVAPGLLERLIFLVSHHHTYVNVDGLDHQILLEADFLVNAEGLSQEAIRHALNTWFKTKTGKRLLRSLYQIKG